MQPDTTVGAAICAAIGLDPAGVTGLTLDVTATSVVAYVKRPTSRDAAEALVEVLRLVPCQAPALPAASLPATLDDVLAEVRGIRVAFDALLARQSACAEQFEMPLTPPGRR